MKHRTFKENLMDINEAFKDLSLFIQNRSFFEFEQDKTSIYTINKSLGTISKASQNIPPSVKYAHSEVSWKKMSAIKDKIQQMFFKGDLEKIWQTLGTEIPALKDKFSTTFQNELKP